MREAGARQRSGERVDARRTRAASAEREGWLIGDERRLRRAMLSVPIVRLDPDLPLPTYAHPGDAGLDLRSRIDADRAAGRRSRARPDRHRDRDPGGLRRASCCRAAGWRSPHGVGLANAPGLIDSAYRGEIKVVLLNTDPHEPFSCAAASGSPSSCVQRVEEVEWLAGRLARRRRPRGRVRPHRPRLAPHARGSPRPHAQDCRSRMSVATLAARLWSPASSRSRPLPRRPDGARSRAAPDSWVVSLGDSYISGEAGRWAGNTNLSPTMTDAGGPGAVPRRRHGRDDRAVPSFDLRRDPHRRGVQSLNLACSGARDRDVHVVGGVLQARPRLLRRRRRTQGPGADAPGVRGDARRARWSRCRSAATTSASPTSSQQVPDRRSRRRPCSRRTTARTIPTVLANFTPERIAAVTAQIEGALRERPDGDDERRLRRRVDTRS